MTEPRRLHRAAILVYSADALRNAAFPLIVIVGMSVLGGGGFEVRDLMRAAIYGAIGVTVSALMGYLRWTSTTYAIGPEAIHHHTGIVREKDTVVPLARIEALDVHQGPLQRAFGVFAVDVQTGAAAKGGEIALPALTPAAVDELRAARPQAAAAVDAPAGPQRRISGRELAFAALTAGQLAVILPVLAAAGQASSQVLEDERGEQAVRLIPHSVTAVLVGAAALLVAAWLLSTLGAIVTFGGFTVTRDADRGGGLSCARGPMGSNRRANDRSIARVAQALGNSPTLSPSRPVSPPCSPAAPQWRSHRRRARAVPRRGAWARRSASSPAAPPRRRCDRCACRARGSARVGAVTEVPAELLAPEPVLAHARLELATRVLLHLRHLGLTDAVLLIAATSSNTAFFSLSTLSGAQPKLTVKRVLWRGRRLIEPAALTP